LNKQFINFINPALLVLKREKHGAELQTMCYFDVFLTVHHSIDFFKLPT